MPLWGVALIAVFASGVGGGPEAAADSAIAGVADGATPGATAAAARLDIQALKFEDMAGRTWTAESLRGRVTLIDVWATWCAPCLSELPYLKRARAAHSRETFEIIGVSIDVSDRRRFVSWINRHGVTWPQVFDGRGRNGPAARQLGVIGVPTSFLMDRNGRVVAMNLRGERLLAAIDALIRNPT